MSDNKKIKWTAQQRSAITERGSDILVTASAGTGKTAVLSGRCVHIVSDKQTCPSVGNILVLTFTEMAAEEMRSRIAQRLRERFLETGDNHLRRQVMLLQGSDISTIHSFCKRLITEYFYVLGLDPTFGMLDGDEQKLLKAETIEKTIEWAWEQENLRSGLEKLFYKRDLRTSGGFSSRIIGLSNFLDTVVSRDDWYARTEHLLKNATSVTGELGQKQEDIIRAKLGRIGDQLSFAMGLYHQQGGSGQPIEAQASEALSCVRKCVELLDSGQWDQFVKDLKAYEKPSRFAAPKDADETVRDIIKQNVKEAIETFVGLDGAALLNPDYLDRFGPAIEAQTRVLMEMVRQFDRFYSQAKSNINCLDFSDLEHYALKLLTNSSGDILEPSETAMKLRDRYKYIFVDEYQDINPVQQAILESLTSGENLFVVGDVKQSIYAFRGAKPDIFLEHLAPASSDPKKAEKGLRVDLNANFRSDKGVLDFVNALFARVMTSSLAHIDYDESAMLRPPESDTAVQTADDDGRPAVELHLLDKLDKDDGDEQSEDTADRDMVSSRQRQAGMIARRIRQILGLEGTDEAMMVFDKQTGQWRKALYRDIVILMRSPSARVNDYVEVLRLAGISVSCQESAGYFEKTEISDCLCLLKVLDNPQRDIELATVLRSPICNVTDTELAKIRIKGRKEFPQGCFFEHVIYYRDNGSDKQLGDKLTVILERIERWRREARSSSLADLIWRIYGETGLIGFFSALPNGRQRKANLLKLHDRAIQFEGFASNSRIASLSRFVEFIEKMQQAGHDWSGAEPPGSIQDAVRIMSVHKSKGLEFPIVFLAELEGRFNKMDTYGDFLADSEATLGLEIIDRESKSRVSSLAHQVIAEVKESTTLAEEMRILYVAATRARQRLILTGCERAQTCRKVITTGYFMDGAIADWQLRKCGSFLRWILFGLSSRAEMHQAFETGLEGSLAEKELFSVTLYGQEQLENICRDVTKWREQKSKRRTTNKGKISVTKQLDELKNSLAWRYGYDEAVKLAAKQSVTMLTHQGDEYARRELSGAIVRRPRLLGNVDMSELNQGAAIGTAVHLVISQLDLTRIPSAEIIREKIDALVAAGAIEASVANKIDAHKIEGFFESELGKAALNSGNRIWQEWPFSYAASDQTQGSETVIVQGIVDMLIRTGDKVYVIDFKTDRIPKGQITSRAEKYRGQLELYGRAAAAILKTNSVSKWVYFLDPGAAFEIC